MQNAESHQDFPLIVELAQMEGVQPEDLIQNTDLMESLSQLHETRQKLLENMLKLIPCEEFKKEMIEIEERFTKDRIHDAIRSYRRRMSLSQINEQELAA